MSRSVLLKGLLVPPYHGNFSIRINGLVADQRDLLQQSLLRVFVAFVVTPLVFYGNLKHSGFHTALSEWRESGLGFESLIWVQDQDNQLLLQYFGPAIILGGQGFQNPYGHWQRKDIQFLFAGQLGYLDNRDKNANQPYRRHRLKFAPLDFIRMSRTITFKHAQDE